MGCYKDVEHGRRHTIILIALSALRLVALIDQQNSISPSSSRIVAFSGVKVVFGSKRFQFCPFDGENRDVRHGNLSIYYQVLWRQLLRHVLSFHAPQADEDEKRQARLAKPLVLQTASMNGSLDGRIRILIKTNSPYFGECAQ